MFVAEGARSRLITHRQDQFRESYVVPLIAEADKLGITVEQLTAMITKGASR